MKIAPRGPEAARLRQRKYQLMRRYAIPDDLLPGSLRQARRRCGKPNCHCARGEGHPIWFLTFMVEGQRRIERIPHDWAAEIEKRVEAGRAYKDAVAEALAANAQLLVLWRRHSGR